MLQSNAGFTFDGTNFVAPGAGTFGGNLAVSGTSSTFNTGNNGTFVTNDANNYPRLTMTSASAQLGLFRAGNGGMYIGGSASGFRIYTTSFAQKLLVDQSGNATFSGTVAATSYFLGTASEISLATTGSGNVFLRPNGQSTSGQMQLASTGNATFAGNISSSGTLQLVGNTGSGF